MVIVDLQELPANWGTRKVDLVGIPALFPDDPEPELVDINDRNIAAVTLQEIFGSALTLRYAVGPILQIRKWARPFYGCERCLG